MGTFAVSITYFAKSTTSITTFEIHFHVSGWILITVLVKEQVKIIILLLVIFKIIICFIIYYKIYYETQMTS